jgi:hypothetical protein
MGRFRGSSMVALWNEAPTRSPALLWMALEALYGDRDRVYQLAPLPYLNRLPTELGEEVAGHFAYRRSQDKPSWARSMPNPRKVTSRQFLEALLESISDLEDELLLKDRTNDVLELDSPERRTGVMDRVRLELQFLYAIRNRMAHTGQSGPFGAIAHYFMNIGLEVLKAAIVEIIATGEGAVPGVKLDEIFQAWSRS